MPASSSVAETGRAGRAGGGRPASRARPGSRAPAGRPRASSSGRRAGRQRHGGRGGPDADQREQLEQKRGPEPETGAAPVAAQRRRQRDVASSAAREQVDRGEQERQQRGEQHELDRPAREHARPEVDVASRAGRELGAGVEPAQELLRRAAELASRTPSSRPGWSVNAFGGRSPPVVSVSAGIPCASSGPCSCSVNGKPRSTSCDERVGCSGRRPVCSITRWAAVSTKPGEASRGSFPISTRRGRPARRSSRARPPPRRGPRASRRSGARRGRRSAPPSVATKTSVCCGLTARAPPAPP